MFVLLLLSTGKRVKVSALRRLKERGTDGSSIASLTV